MIASEPSAPQLPQPLGQHRSPTTAHQSRSYPRLTHPTCANNPDLTSHLAINRLLSTRRRIPDGHHRAALRSTRNSSEDSKIHGPLINVSPGRHPESSSNVHPLPASIAAGQRGEAATLPRPPYAWRMRAVVHLGVLCRRASSYSISARRYPSGRRRAEGGSPVQRLLAIEDEPAIGKVVSRALSLARVRIDGAADGGSGLEMAGSGYHDLVLLDLLRSGLDGVGSAGADPQGRQADTAGDVHADGEGHERVDRAPDHHQADREIARS
jgi:CheY-like chemotaxis protein